MVAGKITMTFSYAMALRDAVRPLSPMLSHDSLIKPVQLISLHEDIMAMLVEFDTEAPETADLILTRDGCLLIEQALSSQDGDWAADILKQVRRAWFELRYHVLPAWAEDNAKIRQMLETRVPDEPPHDA